MNIPQSFIDTVDRLCDEQKAKKEPRRIVQITSVMEGECVILFALCNDGTTWRNDWPCADNRYDEHKWIQLPEIPQ